MPDDPFSQRGLRLLHGLSCLLESPGDDLNALRLSFGVSCGVAPPVLYWERGAILVREIILTKRKPSLVQLGRAVLRAIQNRTESLQFRFKLVFCAGCQRFPGDAPKSSDHIQHFMMAELERRCCKEHHPLEHPIKSATNRAGVLLSIFGHKE
jgi:hypothetical protein